ncbi:hypothetical protein AB0950_40405 [Streptomyces sp. NPDC007189]|uniref:hypothetical protein n=1 Tax=Streptomyces sp. NPDC007189 TaxID=3154315 RepID=UPI0034573316
MNQVRSEVLNLVGQNGLLKGLVKLVLERALEAEMQTRRNAADQARRKSIRGTVSPSRGR